MEGIHNRISSFYTNVPADRLYLPVFPVPLEKPRRLKAMLPVTNDVYQ